jgi:hypothetical protein
MNTRAEISQTFDDYSKTGFGGWPWPESEMVFPQDKGRFSLLDGVETFPTGEGRRMMRLKLAKVILSMRNNRNLLCNYFWHMAMKNVGAHE